jgi:undecaprenyl phosphate-alpha-L-ara4N flippase subunit ArnE
VGLVLLASFIGSFGMAFLKAGAGRLERNVKSLLLNWHLAAGIFLFLLSSVFFVLGIREGELMVLYPMISLGYVWALLWARIFFKEEMTRNKFAGLGMILAGIVLLYIGGN